MEEIYQYTDKLEHDNILLYTPKAVQGGGYYAKIKINNDNLYIQTPKIFTKNGINITGKKVYSDLLFEREHLEFINFIEKIEDRIRKIILQKGELWFTEKPNLEDIEERWNSSIRTYKTKKFLVRTKIERLLNNLAIQIWDENEKMLSPKDINDKTNIIGIFEIAGLKFSSTSFQLDLQLKQIMKFDNKKLFSKCLIKTNKKKSAVVENDLEKTENFKIEMETDNISQDFTNIHQNLNENEDDESGDGYSEDDDSDDSEDDDGESEEGDDNSDYDDDTVENGQSNYAESDEKKLDNVKLFENKKNTQVESFENINNLKNEKNEKNEKVDFTQEENDKITTNHLEETEKKQHSGILEEVNLEILDTETMKLKKPLDVYSEIYKKALVKAREAKKLAIKAYLDANKIKKQYLLDDIESSDAEDLENFSE
tara:strand:+ start:5281 stop:6561 length:1281 start_codon:yes stop_codon:yes gene_type:complete